MKLFLSFMLVLVVALCCAQSTDEETFSCTPNEHFDKDCHACECDATGTYAKCSGFFCDPVNKSILMKSPENCKDDDKWSDGCNDCICIKGSFACSRSMCLLELGKIPVE